MNEEIMNYEENLENEEVLTRRPMSGLEKAGLVAIVSLAGLGAYKIGKAIVKKVKKTKEEKASNVHEGEYSEDNYDEE